MKNDYLNMLASLVLPEIHISLDEKMNSKFINDTQTKGWKSEIFHRYSENEKVFFYAVCICRAITNPPERK